MRCNSAILGQVNLRFEGLCMGRKLLGTQHCESRLCCCSNLQSSKDDAKRVDYLLDLHQGIIAVLEEIAHFLRVHLDNTQQQLPRQPEGQRRFGIDDRICSNGAYEDLAHLKNVTA